MANICFGARALIANDFRILYSACGKTEFTGTLFTTIPMMSYRP
jgi:hypothetical protein